MLQLFSIFHLNLAYSSIEESQRADVMRRCYWPLLRLAERTGAPIGIEATGVTLELAGVLDPSWLERLRGLLSSGQCEFVGSGYAQVIGPLVPAAVNAANLREGHEVYERLLGFRPRIAFVNEQAYSAGLLQHYLDAAYDVIVMEWDNPARAHQEWDTEWGYFPQLAIGQCGEELPIIWNKAIAFQQFQRYAHNESSLDEYLSYLRGHLSERPRALALYGNDAEIFDFRPGRYQTEAAIVDAGEWARIEQAIEAIAADDRFRLIRPSQALDLMGDPAAAHRLRLESAEDPTPVKKQRKYNITRWAVTGRNDLGINTACWRIHDRLVAQEKDRRSAGRAPDTLEHEWRELCELWSSDYRTHITDSRWSAYERRLSTLVPDQGAQPDSPISPDARAATWDGPYLTARTEHVTLVLNCRRGLAIRKLAFAPDHALSLCGTLAHGFYDDIHWGADFYSGMTVLESPGRPKITDLSRVEPTMGFAANGDLVVAGTISTELGDVRKTVRIPRAERLIELEYRLEWPEIPVGSLRLGDVTLNPEAFARKTLVYRTHNGGRCLETFPLDGRRVGHADAVSGLVSASHAIGITDGIVELGDDRRTLRVTVDKTAAALVGMVTFQPVRDSYFCRVSFSAAEVDETRRPTILHPGQPLVCRFVLSPGGSAY